jgi:2-oxoglutarate ferredoxin oxidoreductase subunit delta
MAVGRPSLARGRVVIDEEMCKGCGLCTTVCPYDLIQMATHYNAKGYRPAMLSDPEGRCTGCTLCAMICPDAVITVFRHISVNSHTTSTPQAVTA